MNLVNLTPHTVNLCNANGDVVLTVQPSGTVARVSSTQVVVDTVTLGSLDVDVVKTTLGDVQGLPSPQPDTLLLFLL